MQDPTILTNIHSGITTDLALVKQKAQNLKTDAETLTHETEAKATAAHHALNAVLLHLEAAEEKVKEFFAEIKAKV